MLDSRIVGATDEKLTQHSLSESGMKGGVILKFKIKSHYLFFLFILALSIFLGHIQLTEPKLPDNFTDKIITLENLNNSLEPSLDMAMSHVYNIAKNPHPSGSREIVEVRKYLLSQIEKMGLNYELQEFDYDILQKVKLYFYNKNKDGDPLLKNSYDNRAKSAGFDTYEDYMGSLYPSKRLQHIIVRIGPENPEYQIMMVAHYDGTANGPAAADDGISVASLLETMRILSKSKEQKNSIYFLLTEGEELWDYDSSKIVGSSYFVNNFDLSNIDLVANFEARGNHGILGMFETSENNKNIVKMLSANLENKWIFSFSNAVYKIMPNGTDLTHFLEKGCRGINFAMIGGADSYHMPTDSYENLSRKSAYQYLKTTTELGQYFKNADFSNIDSNEDAMSFSFFRGKTIVLSDNLMKVFGISISIVFISLLVVLIVKKIVPLKEFCISLGLYLLTLPIAYRLMSLMARKLDRYLKSHSELLPLIFNCVISFALMTIFIFIAKKFFKVKNDSFKSAFMFVFALLSGVSAVIMNSASYFFSIPLFLMCIDKLIENFYIKENDKLKLSLSITVKLVIIFVTCMLFIPMLEILQLAIPEQYMWLNSVLTTLSILPILSSFMQQGRHI
jgi:hypothetical protein